MIVAINGMAVPGTRANRVSVSRCLPPPFASVARCAAAAVLRPGLAMERSACDQRVRIRGDGDVSLVDSLIDPHAQAARRLVLQDFSGEGRRSMEFFGLTAAHSMAWPFSETTSSCDTGDRRRRRCGAFHHEVDKVDHPRDGVPDPESRVFTSPMK